MCSSPQLFAAYHVFLRLLVPRHPPCALIGLTFLMVCIALHTFTVSVLLTYFVKNSVQLRTLVCFFNNYLSFRDNMRLLRAFALPNPLRKSRAFIAASHRPHSISVRPPDVQPALQASLLAVCPSSAVIAQITTSDVLFHLEN